MRKIIWFAIIFFLLGVLVGCLPVKVEWDDSEEIAIKAERAFTEKCIASCHPYRIDYMFSRYEKNNCTCDMSKKRIELLDDKKD